MGLHFMAQAVHVVLQLSPHRFESVSDRHIHILVQTLAFLMLVQLRLLLVSQRRLMRNDKFFARHSEFNPDMKRLTVEMMAMGRLNDHTAARDVVEIFSKFLRFLLDTRRDGWRFVDVSEGNLQWQDHNGFVVLSY